MSPVLERDTEYLAFRIRQAGGRDTTLMDLVSGVIVSSQSGERLAHFSEHVDPLFMRADEWPQDEDPATRKLMDRSLSRARGAILLGRLAELGGATYWVNKEPPRAERSDDYLRRLILTAFKRELERSPSHGGRLEFDDLGVALVENVDPGRVEYMLKRLEIGGYLKPWTSPNELGHRPYIITEKGLDEAECLTVPARAPLLLLEETVSAVERMANSHSPELATRLRALAERVFETGELVHIDVGEIAQSCDLILQEFLDIPVVWQGVPGDRPPRDRTRDRLSVVLQARVASETEEELVRSLGDYLFGWFGPLDKFVNKHRHPVRPDLSQRLHAKRLVLYTYMLLADLIEILGIE